VRIECAAVDRDLGDRNIRDQASMASTVSEQMNERMYVLSIVAAIFLPLGLFTGLMGINVGGMPGVEDGAAFWVVVGMCVGLMLILGVIFRWKSGYSPLSR
jgi:zinc transporter